MQRQVFILIMLISVLYLLFDEYFGKNKYISKFTLRVLGVNV